MKKMLIFLAVVAGVATLFWWHGRPQPVAVVLAEVERGRVEQTVANTRAGTVKACQRAALAPMIGGQISHLPVREGQHVKAGTLLLELWNADLKATVDLARRQAESARAQADARCIEAQQALREANRLQQLKADQLVSTDRLDQARSRAESAQAACKAARASEQVAEAEIAVREAQLAKTRLVAPFEGVVVEINGELSEVVTPSPVGIPTPPAIDLISDGCFYVTAPIDEVDVAGVQPGQPVRITLDAFGKQPFAGTVRRVADYVQDAQKQARTVDVEVAFVADTPLPRLLAGYSADVEIVLKAHGQALRIPAEALMEGDTVLVYREEDGQGRLQARKVETGLQNWDFVEILSGLKAGERIVTSVDRDGVKDGALAMPETRKPQ